MPSSQKEKSQRILACVLCSQRKIKCDRKFPCVNCTKSRVQCVTANPAPRQRRGGYMDKEVLERLQKYESLLEKNNIPFEPFQHEQAVDKDSPYEHQESRDLEQSFNSSSPAPLTLKNESVISSENLWQAMSRGSPEPELDENSPSDGPNGSTIKRAWEEEFEDHDFLLLGSHKTAVDLNSLYPEPVQIFRLWQIYLDNVNPLIKVIHAPSMQTRIIDASSNLNGAGHPLEALMFSIYCMSITSLSVDECRKKFNSSKEELLARYEHGCQQALLNSGYLRSADRNCLTALYLYLVSTGSRTDPRSLSSILGIATRIAQRMGIHSEASLVKHTPFEAEMRRRLWWSLVRLDSRIGEMANYNIAISTGTWDCKIPSNVNDSDLRPDMREPPVTQDVPTEALFVAVSSKLSKSISQTMLCLGFTSVPLTQQRGPTSSSDLSTLEHMIEETYLKSCVVENPLHFMTVWTARGTIAKYRLIEHYARLVDPTTSSMHQTEAQRDTAIYYAFNVLDFDTKIASSPVTKAYSWFSHFYFPFPAYVHIIQDMKKRPLSKHAAEAWEIMSQNCEARLADGPKTGSALVRMFSKVISPGWGAREAALKESGESVVLPRIISLTKHYLAQDVQTPTTRGLSGGYSSVDTESFPTSIPMDLGTESIFYDMSIGGQYGFSGPVPGFNPRMTQTSNFTQNQLDWNAMNWDASGN